MEYAMVWVETAKFTKGNSDSLIPFCVTNPPKLAGRFRCKSCNTIMCNQVHGGKAPLLALVPHGNKVEWGGAGGPPPPLMWQFFAFADEGKTREVEDARKALPEAAQIKLAPTGLNPPHLVRGILKRLCGPCCCCCSCDPVCVLPMLCCTGNVDASVKKIWKTNFKTAETLLPGVKEPLKTHTLEHCKDPGAPPAQQQMSG